MILQEWKAVANKGTSGDMDTPVLNLIRGTVKAMITFGILALEAYFFLPGSLMCYRKISDTQAVFFPQSKKEVVTFYQDTPVEHPWQRKQNEVL